AVDGGRALEAGAEVAERVGRGALVVEGNGHGRGRALDGEDTRDLERAGPRGGDLRGAEGDPRGGLHRDAVVGVEVAGAGGVAGVDRGGVDDDLDGGVLDALGRDGDRALVLVERATDLGDHRVAGDKAEARVGGVEGPVSGQGGDVGAHE